MTDDFLNITKVPTFQDVMVANAELIKDLTAREEKLVGMLRQIADGEFESHCGCDCAEQAKATLKELGIGE